MTEKAISTPVPRSSEERWLLNLLAFSLLGHLMFFVISKHGLPMQRQPMIEEWEIEGDLITDTEMSAPKRSALPNAETAPEAVVPDNLLPQLPKKFVINDAAKEEETPDTESDNKVTATTDKDKVVEKQDQKLEMKQDPDEANRIAMDDALKRLALEKLRNDKKVSDKFKAEDKDNLARLKRDASLNKDINAGSPGTGVSVASQKVYGSKIKQHIIRFWSLPEAYNLKNANLQVTIAVAVNESGNLMSSSIKSSSGDKVFDDLAYNAVRNSAPLPLPPKGQAGEEILLNFTPKSF
jgi:TonB family protein